nr:protein TMEM155 isoform X5 [Microcebus murinus]
MKSTLDTECIRISEEQGSCNWNSLRHNVCRLASRSEQLPLAGARRTAAAATAWEPCEEKAGTMGGGRFGKQSCKRSATGVQKFNLPMILLRQENSRAQL